MKFETDLFCTLMLTCSSYDLYFLNKYFEWQMTFLNVSNSASYCPYLCQAKYANFFCMTGFAIRTGYKLTLEKIPFLNVQFNVKNGMRIEEVLSFIFG